MSEEIARAGLPPLADQTHLAAAALIRRGNDQQKARYLPPIRDGRHVWCQLFSEPNAGSDLASLQTRAERHGGGYVVNGQKVWSSNAQWAEYGFLLARTDAETEKHAGISAFVVDMRSPGIEVRPLREITGTSDFNEVFFTDVMIPADSLIGEDGSGWNVAMAALASERSGIGAGAARLRQMVANLVQLARRAEGDELGLENRHVRQELGNYLGLVEICNVLVRSRLARESSGMIVASDIPVGKLLYSELNLMMAELGLELQGTRALLVEGDSDVVDEGRWQDEFLYARTYTIAGGSSEIMRNVLSERVLGLPRDPRQ